MAKFPCLPLMLSAHLPEPTICKSTGFFGPSSGQLPPSAVTHGSGVSSAGHQHTDAFHWALLSKVTFRWCGAQLMAELSVGCEHWRWKAWPLGLIRGDKMALKAELWALAPHSQQLSQCYWYGREGNGQSIKAGNSGWHTNLGLQTDLRSTGPVYCTGYKLFTWAELIFKWFWEFQGLGSMW